MKKNLENLGLEEFLKTSDCAFCDLGRNKVGYETDRCVIVYKSGDVVKDENLFGLHTMFYSTGSRCR